MANKFYGVRTGRIPGVYGTWDECKEQVDKFPGAQYKSFKSREEAEDYVAGKETPEPVKKEQDGIDPWSLEVPDSVSDDTAYAFVDGSFNIATKTYGYGGFLVSPVVNGKRNVFELSGAGSDTTMAGMRNVAGEVLGTIAATEAAAARDYKKLMIFYDYLGIEQWATGKWNTYKPGAASYKMRMDVLKESFGMDISFKHIDAHTGIAGNELADRMAKKAVGLRIEKQYQEFLDKGLSDAEPSL